MLLVQGASTPSRQQENHMWRFISCQGKKIRAIRLFTLATLVIFCAPLGIAAASNGLEKWVETSRPHSRRQGQHFSLRNRRGRTANVPSIASKAEAQRGKRRKELNLDKKQHLEKNQDHRWEQQKRRSPTEKQTHKNNKRRYFKTRNVKQNLRQISKASEVTRRNTMMAHRKAQNSQQRIVGGFTVPRGRYPSQIACYDAAGIFKCGGTLISSSLVLTAGHCIGACAIIRVNLHDRRREADLPGNRNVEEFNVTTSVRHPRYGDGPPAGRFDLGLILMSGRSEVTPMVLCDDQTAVRPGANVTVIGWGSTTEGGPISVSLRETDVTFMSNRRCMDFYGHGNGKKPPRISPDMMCAAVPGGGRDACQGDSGGPLIFRGDCSSDDMQLGVVSWGNGCARAKWPGVYSRVFRSREWIKEAAAELDEDSVDELRWYSQVKNLASKCGSTTDAASSKMAVSQARVSTSIAGDGVSHENAQRLAYYQRKHYYGNYNQPDSADLMGYSSTKSTNAYDPPYQPNQIIEGSEESNVKPCYERSRSKDSAEEDFGYGYGTSISRDAEPNQIFESSEADASPCYSAYDVYSSSVNEADGTDSKSSDYFESTYPEDWTEGESSDGFGSNDQIFSFVTRDALFTTSPSGAYPTPKEFDSGLDLPDGVSPYERKVPTSTKATESFYHARQSVEPFVPPREPLSPNRETVGAAGKRAGDYKENEDSD